MANHKSSIKRIKKSQTRKLNNKYYVKTARNVIKNIRNTTDKVQADELHKKVSCMLDKLAKKNIIHKNKASNVKSKLALYVNNLR